MTKEKAARLKRGETVTHKDTGEQMMVLSVGKSIYRTGPVMIAVLDELGQEHRYPYTRFQ